MPLSLVPPHWFLSFYSRYRMMIYTISLSWNYVCSGITWIVWPVAPVVSNSAIVPLIAKSEHRSLFSVLPFIIYKAVIPYFVLFRCEIPDTCKRESTLISGELISPDYIVMRSREYPESTFFIFICHVAQQSIIAGAAQRNSTPAIFICQISH